jgi:hypothetical protein
MVATSDLKMAASIGKASLLDIFHPGSVDTQRNLILALTCCRASVASNTLAIIDDETVVHKQALLRG